MLCPVQTIVYLVKNALSSEDEEALQCLELRFAYMENTRHKYEEVLTAEEFSEAAHPDYFRGATMQPEESAAQGTYQEYPGLRLAEHAQRPPQSLSTAKR